MKNSFKFLAISSVLALTLTACGPQSGKADKDQDETQTKETTTSTLDKIQLIVDKSSRGQYKASKTFEGPDGMIGVVLEPNAGGAKMIGWASPNAETLSPGPLFTKDGDNLSEKLLAEHAGFLAPEKLADQIGERGFIAGKSGPIVTVFFEPYCGYCNQLFNNLKPLIEKGELRVRFVMVGFLRPDSHARAADIEFASNPYKALTAWEELKDKGKAKPSKAPEDKQNEIRTNSRLMNEAGQSGTPALLFCNKDGKLSVVSGMPADFNTFISSVGSEGHAICK